MSENAWKTVLRTATEMSDVQHMAFYTCLGKVQAGVSICMKAEAQTNIMFNFTSLTLSLIVIEL